MSETKKDTRDIFIRDVPIRTVAKFKKFKIELEIKGIKKNLNDLYVECLNSIDL